MYLDNIHKTNLCSNLRKKIFLKIFREFVSVMKQRAMRGLEKPKEIGISRVFTSIFKCAADCRPAVIGGVRRTE